ncbi:MAG: branched-chain amino acid ABC transporter permease [Desulfobacterales bacterium]|jgi:branched-chain amino acid transport system permease protein|nr:branched-chain amino acid ABC transporter permease [Desulfobacteraceae bacterium]MDD3991162.1 branched-chain amino acid ABC transporter permease [Desulfobacteraceae bacterium]MDY0311610.1 branched-chain amino acid ABC transporter permease [Desulfobacterales bacterium]
MSRTDPAVTVSRGLPVFMGRMLAGVPLLGWLLGFLVAVLIEQAVGEPLAQLVSLPKMPVLFGILTVSKVIAAIINTVFKDAAFDPAILIHVPAAIAYLTVVYLAPIVVVARISANIANRAAGAMNRWNLLLPAIVHLGLMYVVLHIWAGMSDYRLITLKITLIAVLLTLSLNIINGYMGEFSCSHPGFMAVGAYMSSLFTVGLFVDDRVLGNALMACSLDFLSFPLALIFGGICASAAALLVAIPSFKTRGDYLAIISLAFLFIIKSLFENLQALGGSRGIAGQPDWATLPVIFIVVGLGIWSINNFVTSTFGKALNAVRDDELAAEAMTVNTRKAKMTAFLVGAFWAGVAGGLLAHVLRYINPAMFGIQKLAEVLAMVYFGGLNSVYGSIVGAVSIGLLGEALRPLEILKWIIIPLLLILVMIYRPTGLVAFRDFDLREAMGPKTEPGQRK